MKGKTIEEEMGLEPTQQISPMNSLANCANTNYGLTLPWSSMKDSSPPLLLTRQLHRHLCLWSVYVYFSIK